MGANPIVAEIEHTIEGNVVAVEIPGQETVDADCLAFAQAPQLGDGTPPGPQK